MKTIDVRGLSCPQPVVLVSQTLKNNSDSFEIHLDSEASKENVLRLLEKNKIEPNIVEKDTYTVYEISR